MLGTNRKVTSNKNLLAHYPSYENAFVNITRKYGHAFDSDAHLSYFIDIQTIFSNKCHLKLL